MSSQTQALQEREMVKSDTGSGVPVGKILIVEDDPDLRTLLDVSLHRHGYEVTGCSSSDNALDELRHRDFDLLLTDLMMPEMDGIALLKAALEIDPHLVGIIITGQGKIRTAVDAMQSGAFDYVLKPFSPEMLMPVLTRAMNVRHLKLENVQLRETVAIHSLCQTIAFTLDPQTVLSKLADAALQQSDADEVSVLLPINNDTELQVAAVRGRKRERLLGERIPFDQSIASWVARERTRLLLNGPVNDERFIALWPRSDIHSSISIPMLVANNLVGVINLNVTSRPRPFSLGQMKALTILASTAAAALESASLYAQIRATEEKYRSIFENATEGLFRATTSDRLLTVNPAYARIMGYDSPQEMIETITDVENQLYVRPEDRAAAGRHQKETGSLEGFEFEAYRKNREKIWLSLNRRSILDQNGEVLYFEGSVEDITARRQIEEDKRHTRQQYESLVQSIDGIVWEFDVRPFKFTFVSNQCERLLGYAPEQWLSDPDFWKDHLHPDDRSWVLETCGEAMAKRADHEFDYRMIAADGRVVWFRDIVTVDRMDIEHPLLRGVMVDITGRKLAEDELKKSEERYRDLVENAHDLIYEHDLKGNYTAINKAGERTTGYSLEESLKLNVAQTVAPDYLEKAQEMLRRKLAGESVTAYDLVVIAKDGRRVPVEVNTRLVLKDGIPVGVQGIARDITERNRVEELQARRAAHALFRADVSAALAMSSAPLRVTLESCVTAMVEHLGAAFARIWTLNHAEEMLELQASAGMYTHIDGPHSRVPVGSFKIGKIAQERVPHITNEVQTDPQIGDKEWARREGIVAFASYPLLLENRMLGVMGMFSREELADDTLDALASVADLISQGIERRRVEEDLRESEERYRLLFESNPQPMWVYDLETLAFLAVNESAVHHYGYSRADFLAMTIEAIRPVEDITALYDSVSRSTEGVDRAAIWRHLKKDGTIIEVEVTSHLLVFDDRRAELILAHDITERRRAEEALRDSEARKRAILESSMDCIITMDHEGVVVDWNPAAEKTFGYTQEEVIGKEMALLIIPQRFREQHRQGVARHLATREGRAIGQRLELNAVRSDGTEFPIELTITRIESKGAPMFTGYLRDITERKRAESRLAAQYAVTRALAESNTIGEGASKILQAVCGSLGWEYGALWTVDRGADVLRCSQTWQAPDTEADEFESASYHSVFKRGIGLPARVWNDSQPVWIADAAEDTNFPSSAIAAKVGLHGGCAFPIRLRSEVLGVVEFFSRAIREPDPELLAMMVTIGSQIGQFIERKRVEDALGESEEQLRQSQKLEAIGQLAGGVAHDFNNLLTAINGYSELALRRVGEEQPIASYLEEIKKAGDRAANLTRQLLAFGRKQLLQPVSLSLNDVVTDMSKMLKRLIGENIDFVAKLSPELKQIKADPGQLEQVLVNLVVNARDAMPSGGTLTIETTNAQLDGAYASKHVGVTPGKYVMLMVSDTGIGMDQETQVRIFEPFFTTKEKGKGTGLGLSTVYGIVKQSGGNVWVYSEPKRGTSFKIYLPQSEVGVGDAGTPAIVLSIKRGWETVLLVEDEDMVRNLARELLKENGYTVLEASGGEEAIRLCQKHKEVIHLLITDVVMPKMSGKDVAHQLQMVHPETKVLFMSGYTDEAIVHHGIVDSHIAFIQKPFSETTLTQKIRDVLDAV